MISNDEELKATQKRIAYFQNLLLQFRQTVRPEEFVFVTQGYRSEIEQMQADVTNYLRIDIFTKLIEYDGMVLLESAEDAEKNVRWLKETGKWVSRWKYERGSNHTHPHMTLVDRERVRDETKISAEFTSVMRRNYPERNFVISHIPGYAVSFFQAIEGAPTEDIAPKRTPKETAWCQHCQRPRPYHLLPIPDPEFPKVEWGACEVCGNDLILYAGEILTLLKSNSVE